MLRISIESCEISSSFEPYKVIISELYELLTSESLNIRLMKSLMGYNDRELRMTRRGIYSYVSFWYTSTIVIERTIVNPSCERFVIWHIIVLLRSYRHLRQE